MTVISAPVAIFLKRAPEFRNHHDDGIVPSVRTQFLGKARQAPAEFAEPVCHGAGSPALAYMRIPAADIDETEIVLFAHQPANSARRQFEALGRDRATVGRGHFLGRGFIHVVANLEALGHRAGQRILCIHARDQFGLAIIDSWFGDRTNSDIGYFGGTAEYQRQLFGEGDRLGAGQHGRQAAP